MRVRSARIGGIGRSMQGTMRWRLLGRPGEIAQALQSRISSRRISWSQVSWSKVGIALSATVILASGLVLSYRLRGLDWAAVATAVQAVSLANVAGAAFFVACGYATLALYDWFALRTIGARQVPFRIAALAGATSYAIGHGLGATALASAVIRFRIYSRWGLGLIDIAKICFIAGLTFWLGN